MGVVTVLKNRPILASDLNKRARRPGARDGIGSRPRGYLISGNGVFGR